LTQVQKAKQVYMRKHMHKQAEVQVSANTAQVLKVVLLQAQVLVQMQVVQLT
jgi:uncharacterized protein (UPF0548 family)